MSNLVLCCLLLTIFHLQEKFGNLNKAIKCFQFYMIFFYSNVKMIIFCLFTLYLYIHNSKETTLFLFTFKFSLHIFQKVCLISYQCKPPCKHSLNITPRFTRHVFLLKWSCIYDNVFGWKCCYLYKCHLERGPYNISIQCCSFWTCIQFDHDQHCLLK